MSSTAEKPDLISVPAPTVIEILEGYIGRLIPYKKEFQYGYALRRNIGYALQYLEYLDWTRRHLWMTVVIECHTYKSFVLTVMGIVEAVLYYLLLSKDALKTTEWREIQAVKSNEFRLNDAILKQEVHIFEKLNDPEVCRADLDSLIKRVEKRQLLGTNTRIYKHLNYLRKIRNRVHLHLIQDPYDHDLNRVTKRDFQIARAVLYRILTHDIFSPESRHLKYFDYLTEK